MLTFNVFLRAIHVLKIDEKAMYALSVIGVLLSNEDVWFGRERRNLTFSEVQDIT